MHPRERTLHEAGFTKNTRAVSTLLTQLLMVDVYGVDHHTESGKWEVTGEELMAKQREVGGQELKKFVERIVPACTPRSTDEPVGLGTAPVLMVGWLYGRDDPDRFEKFCREIRLQRCSLVRELKKHIDPTKKRNRSTLTAQELFDMTRDAWEAYR